MNIRMIRKIVVCMVVLGFVSKSMASGKEWLTDFEKAKKQAVKQNVPILINFSGSDWCGWCIRLDKEVFSQKVFKDYAKDNLVLLLLDFPRKSEQSDKVKAANNLLAQKYGLRGFPTVLIVDKNGKIIAKTGYQQGGAEKYVEHIKKLIKSDKK
ncbi:MAG: thioredoxin family protein [Verrucomicrobiota bacterium]|nr:thioredoxin family protein [Verrucomicrobiota bacterium]